MIAAERPFSKAQAKKVLFMKSLFGKPNEMFETHSVVCPPSSFCMKSEALGVSAAALVSARVGYQYGRAVEFDCMSVR